MARGDWRGVSIEEVAFDPRELAAQLLPALRERPAPGTGEAEEYGRKLVGDCRGALSAIVPLRDNEAAFLDLLLDRGEIDGSILTGDRALADRISGAAAAAVEGGTCPAAPGIVAKSLGYPCRLSFRLTICKVFTILFIPTPTHQPRLPRPGTCPSSNAT